MRPMASAGLLIALGLAVSCGESDDIAVNVPGGHGPTCTYDGNCAPPYSYCHPSALVCVECLVDGNCGGSEPFCSSAGRCVECVGSDQCGVWTCDPAAGECVPSCDSDADCSPDAEAAYCNTSQHVCVQCLNNGNCGAEEPYCDPGTLRCAECFAPANCGADKPFCGPNLSCVECLVSANCLAGQVCSSELQCVD